MAVAKISPQMTERERLNKITEVIISAAIEVLRTLGPGLLESAYVACLAYELEKIGDSLTAEFRGQLTLWACMLSLCPRCVVFLRGLCVEFFSEKQRIKASHAIE